METLNAPSISVKGKDLIKVASELGPVISQNIDEEENNGRLTAPVVNALRKAGFFKLFLPKSLGGLEADPVTTAEVVEEVARHNTAGAWSLMVANTTIFMGGHFPEKGIAEIFGKNPDALIAGSIHPPMKAVRTEGGYLINGRNPLISNVHEGQWIFATAFVMEGEQMKMIDGHPEIIAVIMNADDCRIIDTWHTLGMCATDSNDVEAIDVFVPDHLFCPLTPEYNPGRHFKGPLYRFPAAGANIASLLAPVSLGVAQNAINELKTLADKKTPLGSSVPIRERGVVQRKLGRAEALVQSSRAYLHDKLAKCWSRTLAGEEISLEEKAGLLLAAAHVNQSCVEATELMYTAAGTTGIYKKNKLSHYFTDAQVLRQHGFMNESRYETAAQIYLGLPPDLPIIAF
ncbi:MAG TPA: acyl-CoA dehydrogenase family protein [Chitinophagaceae bacterium]|nr:acyl-CoA dehydrogenase family protein [Chitinophagaceae bacterium]